MDSSLFLLRERRFYERLLRADRPIERNFEIDLRRGMGYVTLSTFFLYFIIVFTLTTRQVKSYALLCYTPANRPIKKEAFSVLLVVKRALAKTHYEPGVDRIYRQ